MVTTFSGESNSSQAIAVATSAPGLLLVNSTTGTVVREAAAPPSVITHLQFSHSLLFSGTSDGHLYIHDQRTGLQKEMGESNVRAHLGGLQGMQISGNFAFTIGWGVRCTSRLFTIEDAFSLRYYSRHSRPFPDPLVKVWDVRTMRALTPVPFSAGPAFITVLPRRSASIVVTSNQGLINIVDVSSSASEFYQVLPFSIILHLNHILITD